MTGPARRSLARARNAVPAVGELPVSALARLCTVSVDGRGRHRRTALRARLAAVLSALDTPVPTSTGDRLSALAQLLADADQQARQDLVWLVTATITGRLPDRPAVLRRSRQLVLDGPWSFLHTLLGRLVHRPGASWPQIGVVTGAVLVDLHHTARTDLATGIQRVARRTTAEWVRSRPDVVLVGWTSRLDGLRVLPPDERARALGEPAVAAGREEIVVPWRSTYLLPELMTERARTDRLQALLRHSRSRSGLIAFDMVPISSAETTADGMGPAFAGMLTAAAHADVVAAISQAAGDEWRGWRRMLTGTGLTGPEVAAVSLPTEALAPDDATTEQARLMLKTDEQGTLPLVLCVGSHEPRKNHGAVLAAAETLWSEGQRFGLLMVGGNAWHSEPLVAEAEALQASGRPLSLVSALSDPLLWAAYRLARCTVFPSYAEGFGLPVAESLAVGTPVLTSGYGSMREIAEDGGGALLVDPRDDASVTDGLRRLLTDDAFHDELVRQARSRPVRTWPDYAEHVWQVLVGSAETSGPDRSGPKTPG